MFLHTKLACSFCGKSAAEVSKLVAGPRVFICESCVAAANRIINDPTLNVPQELSAKQSLWRRLLNRLHNVHNLALGVPS